jgi:Flp pilus assembly CpaE family ATPase
VTGSGRIQVYLVGTSAGLDEVRGALEQHDEFELVGTTASAAESENLPRVALDAIVVATSEPELPHAELSYVRALGDAPVILLAPASAPNLLEEALVAGVADALLMPQPPESVLFALRKIAAPRAEPVPDLARGLVATVFSPKGGTGKSVTSTNLAASLAKFEQKRTLLVDLDLQFGDAAVMIGLEPAQTIYDLVSAPGALDVDKLAGYTGRHESGFDVIAAPHRPEEAELVAPVRVGSLLEVAREAYDVIVIDSSPFVHGPLLAALDRTDLLLLVATLDVPALKDVRQSLETLELIRFPRDRIAMVLNRANAKVGITRGDVEAALGVRMRYTLPSEEVVPLSVNRGLPVVFAEPGSEYAQAMRAVAADVASRRPAPVTANA